MMSYSVAGPGFGIPTDRFKITAAGAKSSDAGITEVYRNLQRMLNMVLAKIPVASGTDSYGKPVTYVAPYLAVDGVIGPQTAEVAINVARSAPQIARDHAPELAYLARLDPWNPEVLRQTINYLAQVADQMDTALRVILQPESAGLPAVVGKSRKALAWGLAIAAAVAVGTTAIVIVARRRRAGARR